MAVILLKSKLHSLKELKPGVCVLLKLVKLVPSVLYDNVMRVAPVVALEA